MIAHALGVIGAAVILITCTTSHKDRASPVQVVPHVDLNRYVGTWYEIARYPNRFQEGCVGSTARYSLRDDGKIDVLNECYLPASGKHSSARGTARIVDQKTNARLKVTFFWPFAGDYWIIDLGDDYEYAVVGHPERKYLWILSRSPEMGEDLYTRILERITRQGYDVTKLIKTEQASR